MKFLLVLILAVLKNSAGLTAEKEAVPHSRPFQVYINLKPEFYASGVIINKNTILTTVYPCLNAKDSPLQIIAGANVVHNETEPSHQQERTSVEVIIHPDYDLNFFINTTCLVKLDRDLEFNEYVSPIALPEKGEVFTGDATLSGWHSVNRDESWKIYNPLREVTGPIVSDEVCANTYYLFGIALDMEQVLCFDAADEKGCIADLGGPLTVKDPATGKTKLVGLLNGARFCAEAGGDPEVAFKASYFIDWINQYLN